MTERERFHRVIHGEAADRPPLLEEGVRDEVLANWHGQGLPRDKTHLEVFGLTPHENIGPNLRYKSSYFGRIMDLSTRGYRKAFNVSRRRFPGDWHKTVKRLEHRDHIVCIWASRGFFQALGVGDWATLEQVLFGVIENPKKDPKADGDIRRLLCPYARDDAGRGGSGIHLPERAHFEQQRTTNLALHVRGIHDSCLREDCRSCQGTWLRACLGEYVRKHGSTVSSNDQGRRHNALDFRSC